MKISLCVAAALSLTGRATAKTRPVMKIVRMLQDMQKKLQLELEDDKAVFEKLQCWCKTGADEKQKAIELAEATIAQLDASMGGIIAKMEELKEKRKATLAEVNSDHASKTEADEARIKENKQFQAEETDLLEAVAASKQALVVLGKHNPSLAQVRDVVHSLQVARVSQLVSGVSNLDSSSMDTLKKFLQSSNGVSFLQIPGMKSFAPQSGQIFGILQQMQVDFEKNLADLQKTEKKAVEEYESLKAAKEEEIKAGREAVAQLDEDLANLLEKHAQEATIWYGVILIRFSNYLKISKRAYFDKFPN